MYGADGGGADGEVVRLGAPQLLRQRAELQKKGRGGAGSAEVRARGSAWPRRTHPFIPNQETARKARIGMLPKAYNGIARGGGGGAPLTNTPTHPYTCP